MRMTKWKRGKTVLPLLLSAMMVIESAGTMPTVYAEEIMPLTEQTDLEQGGDTDGDSAEGVEEEKTEIRDGTEGGFESDADHQGNEEDVKNEEEGGQSSGSEDADEGNESAEEPTETEDVTDPTEIVGDEVSDNDKEEEEPTEEIEGELGEDTVSDNNLEEGDTVSSNDLGNGETPDGFTGMPASYKLTEAQMESKRLLADYAGEINGFTEGSDYAKGQVVTLAESQKEAEMIAEAYDAKIVRFNYGILTLQLEENTTVAQAVKLAADTETNIPAVWPNYYRHLMEGDNDGIEIETQEYEIDAVQEALEASPETSYRAALEYTDEYLQPDSAYYQWHHTVIGSPYAWREGYTGSGIKVAVLDSGVQASHTDLPMVNNINEKGSSDSEGHGTHVAGIIAAKANGSLGVGVAPDVTLYSGNLGKISTAEILETLAATKGKGIHLVNMSIGGLGFVSYEQDFVNALYNEGTAIFASAGNDGGQTYSYPACYEHVISVAATDKNNGRASFSNYCDRVDLSAPGVDIWSADSSNINGYVSMDGTSMACPVAVGEAAVILSGNKELRDMSGGKRVDELESLMKKNAVKAGSGMGAGLTSLTKVFGLSTAATKPMAPKIEVTPDNTAAAQRVTVKITAQAGTTVYFTSNGKNPAFKNGEPDEKTGTEIYTGVYGDSNPLVISDQAKGTVKAIAVNESGVASAATSVSFKLTPYVSDIEISGAQRVIPGKSIQLSAAVSPAYAVNKKVTWELYKANADGTQGEKVGASGNVKIATNGKVTATGAATAEKYFAVATAQDQGGAKSDPYPIEVISGSIFKEVKFLDAENKPLKKVTVTLPTEKSYDLASFLKPVLLTEGTKWSANDFKWSSNKTDIAKVNGKGVVIPKKAGKATITALADDSSGKKASVTVTVVQLAEDLDISGPEKIAPSKSVAFKAVVTPAWTNNKKVVWEIYDASGKKIDPKEDSVFAKSTGVTINVSNGKVTATKTAKPGEYTVKAFTQDSADHETKTWAEEKKITVTEGIINKVSFPTKADSNVKLFRKVNGRITRNTAEINVKIEGTKGADLGAYTVSNSNAGIARCTDITADKSSGDITLKITATGRATGKTKITITSADGSNKKASCNVTVVNPVSGITIAPPAGLSGAVAQGKSLQMKARAESEYGTITNKNVTWELYKAHYELKGTETVLVKDDVKVDAAAENQLGIKIAASGKVTAKKDAVVETDYPYVDEGGNQLNAKVPVPYIVRATSKDDSGTYGEYTITVGECGSEIRLMIIRYLPDGQMIIDREFVPSKVGLVESDSWYDFLILGDIGQGGYSVSSSNPKVASVLYTPDARNAGYLTLKTYVEGSATITVRAMDGSGMQAKYNFIVKKK